MHVPVSEAKAQLTDLVRRAEAGEEVVLTRRGRPAARIVPERTPHDREALIRTLNEVREVGRRTPSPGPCAARSADFLFDEDGMPG